MSNSTPKKMFRANKTTRNKDDYKVLIVGIVCAIVILVLPQFAGQLKETRFYRDITKLTPFYNVELYYSSVVDGGNRIVFGGTLTKRRCEYDDLVGYVTGQYGQRHRVIVDTTVEDLRGVTGNRPSSDNPEAWGPWSIDISNIKVFDNSDLIPKEFDVTAFHVECPTEPVEQNNLFVEAPWGDFLIELPNSTPLTENVPTIIEE